MKVRELQGNGDFRSDECVSYLKEADVVVTNPPFSLFRQYVKQLMDYGKKFIIIGPLTAVGYKEIFSNIKDTTMWLGMNKVTDFQNYYTNEIGKVGCRWFTNMINKKRTEPIDLYKKYNEKEYPKYANYNGIDCKSIAEIPIDYEGNIGVPLSILDNYCPTQFEIVGLSTGTLAKEIGITKGHRAKCGFGLEIYKDGKYIEPFKRLIVKFANNNSSKCSLK